jgi:antitoxin component HigA of HigAB toxin-antitoxin module
MQNGDTPCIVPQSLYEFWTVATRKPNPQSALSGLGMTPDQAYAEIVAQINLQPILGARGVTSEIVNGKRSTMKEQAKRLGAFFGVSPAVFI